MSPPRGRGYVSMRTSPDPTDPRSRISGGTTRLPNPSLALLALLLVAVVDAGPLSARAGRRSHVSPTPAFSRMYGTACSTCHTAAPKLNVLGEAFRLNGYRLPRNPTLVRRDEPVSLGAPEWDEAWPRAIRSSDLPGLPPMAIRIVSDVEVTRDERVPYEATYRFPQEMHVLASAPLGEAVSVHFEGAWEGTHGFDVHQARVELQDVVPGMPDRALDMAVGLQHLYPLTLMDQHLDLAGRQTLRWQTFDASEVEVRRSGDVETLSTGNRLSLDHPQSTVEINGLLGGRLYYGVGLSQGLQHGLTDANARKDLYYKVRYKLGGLDFAGRYEPGHVPDAQMRGQLLDRGLIIEHFGYFGDETTGADPQGDHQALGVAVRALLGRADLGIGYVIRDFERPWSELATGDLEAASLFGRGEYLVLPWVLASLKAERFSVSAGDLPPGSTMLPVRSESTRIIPGVILLIRQNVRLVLEGELYTRTPATVQMDLARPHTLWMRLDVAF